MGGTLGTLFTRAGHEVVFSYARSTAKLQRLAQDAGARAHAGSPAEAVREADAVLLAVHWLRVGHVLQQAGDLSGKVVVTCSLPMNSDDTGLVIGHTWSGAEELARQIPHAKVVSAFGTVPSEVFAPVFDAQRRTTLPNMAYCSDHADARSVAVRLIRGVGFEPVDAGPLRTARYLEPFALLMGRLAYEGAAGPEVAYRFERFPM
jgi:predicted dinucleotide-binding enzyme